MYQTNLIMQYIDELRKKRNIKVVEFNQGITTPRTYSRYVSGEFDIEVNRLMAYINRLNFNLPDFLQYVYNSVRLRNYNHLRFIKMMKRYDIDSALDLMGQLDKKSTSEVSKLLLPIYFLKLKHDQKKLTKTEFLDLVKKKINLKEILLFDAISRQEFQSMIFFYEYCSEKDRSNIVDYLEQLIAGKKKVMSLEYHIDRMHAYLFLIEHYLKQPEWNEPTHHHVEELFNQLFKHMQQLSVGEMYPDVIEDLVRYHQRIGNDDQYRLAVFYLVSYHLSIPEFKIGDISKEYLQIYQNVITSKELYKGTFFDRMRFEL